MKKNHYFYSILHCVSIIIDKHRHSVLSIRVMSTIRINGYSERIVCYGTWLAIKRLKAELRRTGMSRGTNFRLRHFRKNLFFFVLSYRLK